MIKNGIIFIKYIFVNKTMAEYFAHAPEPIFSQYPSVEEAFAFLDKVKDLIRQAHERGECPFFLQQEQKRASDYIACVYIWALP